MKIINKKILAAVLVAATLTGCDSLMGADKKEEAKTETSQPAEENKDKAEDTDKEKTDEEDKDAKEDKEAKEDKDSKEDSKDSKEESEALTNEGTTTKEKLEDAIFNNRVQARAAEILLDSSPDTIEDIKADLEALVKSSNELIDKATEALNNL